jgi:hypothetical protein
MSMNCNEVLNELPLFVGDDLESPSRERVAQHLESCVPCSAELAQAKRSRAALGTEFERTAAGFPRVSAWPSLRERLLAEGLIRTGASGTATTHVASDTSRARPSSGGRLLRFAGVAAAAAALFLFGTFTGRLFPDVERSSELDPSLVVTPVVVTPVNTGLGTDGVLPDGGALAGGSGLEPVRRGEALSEVRSVDDVMFNRARTYYSQPVVPFNALVPGTGARPASFPSTEWK